MNLSQMDTRHIIIIIIWHVSIISNLEVIYWRNDPWTVYNWPPHYIAGKALNKQMNLSQMDPRHIIIIIIL